MGVVATWGIARGWPQLVQTATWTRPQRKVSGAGWDTGSTQLDVS